MALIEVDIGIFYDTEKTWYEQTPDCIALGRSVMETTPKSENNQTEGTHTRLVSAIWETTTATGTFDMKLNENLTAEQVYLYPIESKAFKTKKQQSVITVVQIS